MWGLVRTGLDWYALGWVGSHWAGEMQVVQHIRFPMLSQEVLTQLEKENERDVCCCNIFVSLHSISHRLALLNFSFRGCPQCAWRMGQALRRRKPQGLVGARCKVVLDARGGAFVLPGVCHCWPRRNRREHGQTLTESGSALLLGLVRRR
jgi:hypothetical protein